MAKHLNATNIVSQRLTSGVLNSVINEMVEGDHPDNSTILGHIMQGNRCIQVQLVVIQDQSQFMEWIG